MPNPAKIFVLYRAPGDPATFDARYFDGHVPLVETLPGLRRMEFHKGVGRDAPYYLMAEMTFDSAEDMRACLRSEQMAAVVRDVDEFAAGLYTVLLVETAQSKDMERMGS